jgi:hypothetical protein
MCLRSRYRIVPLLNSSNEALFENLIAANMMIMARMSSTSGNPHQPSLAETQS